MSTMVVERWLEYYSIVGDVWSPTVVVRWVEYYSSGEMGGVLQ